ncbi:LacI family DNA-binding transcriptional regulator [Pelagicoccus mobilis]|uniref:LacI family DNA-binding transcriptional regulator n=1 Tax=Pelagicoccus mobilis TaxID=415221 RepID=A0A934VRJ4_9BACT|nr:LacI family DNA-binding transcriptional regulator [Pelagicoccus mobilis]MBK1877673.1 LacI family DNA-binding transcriptional regulator [Pelagicoccus mobilis]
MDDVARAAGVAKATVCRALQNRPVVAKATRERILKAARELGYQADPSLSALSQRRWSDGGKRTYRQVALVHYESKKYLDKYAETPNEERYRLSPRALLFPAAKEKAKLLGYQISEYSTSDYKNSEQLSRILYNRGIDGLLLSIEGPISKIELPWERFSAIAIGLGLDEYNLPHVSSDWMSAVSLAVQKAKERGYRRIGFIKLVHENPSIDFRISSAIEFQRHGLESQFANRIPTLSGQREDFNPWQDWIPVFKEWYDRWKPDVVVDGTHCASHWFKTIGVKVPEECAIVAIDRTNHEDHKHISYVDHNYAAQGEWAMEFLSTMIQNSVKGQTDIPPRLTLPCTWQEGSTLPPKQL